MPAYAIKPSAISCQLPWHRSTSLPHDSCAPLQVANYRSFAEQRAQQLGRTFDSLFDDVPAAGATRCTCKPHLLQSVILLPRQHIKCILIVVETPFILTNAQKQQSSGGSGGSSVQLRQLLQSPMAVATVASATQGEPDSTI